MVQQLWKTVWRFLEKLNKELPYDPAIPLLGIYIYLREMRSSISKKYLPSMFTAALFIIAVTWK